MRTSAAGIAALVADEGEVLNAYRDVVGVWTIGVGLTAASGLIKPTAGMKITREESRRLLALALEKRYEPAVARVLPKAKQHEFDGAVSFHYNTGAIATASWPDKFKAGAISAAKSAFLSWNKGGKPPRPIKGLTLRRQREWDLIEKGVYPHGIKPTVTPATPAPAVAEEPTKVLTLGSNGEAVVDLQRRLQALKLYVGSLDGKFGPKTEAAVKAFQRSHPVLIVDGKAGPATLATLKRMEAAPKSAVVYGAVGAGAAATGLGVAPLWIGVGVAVIAACALGWVAWRYRDEWRARLGGADV